MPLSNDKRGSFWLGSFSSLPRFSLLKFQAWPIAGQSGIDVALRAYSFLFLFIFNKV